MAAGRGSKINWVSCDSCGDWQVFENCIKELGLEKFDAEKIKGCKYQCRMCKYEEKFESEVSSVKRALRWLLAG